MGLGGFWQQLFPPCQHHRVTFLDCLYSLVIFLQEKSARQWEFNMAESLGASHSHNSLNLVTKILLKFL